jgi:hypothetical protein
MPRTAEEVNAQLARVQALRDQKAALDTQRLIDAQERENDATFLRAQEEELRLAADVAVAQQVLDAEKASYEADSADVQARIAANQEQLDAINNQAVPEGEVPALPNPADVPLLADTEGTTTSDPAVDQSPDASRYDDQGTDQEGK